MKIHAAILLTGGFASTGAFAPTGTNTATQPLRLRPGFETFIGKSHANAPLYRRDVSVGLFRNLLRKFKDGEDKEPDDGDNAVGETGKEDESSSSLKINAEAVSAGTDAEDKKSETDVEEKKEEKRETRRMLPFFAAAPVSSEESDSVKVDKTDASEVKSEEVSKEVEAPNMVLEIPEETETPLSKAEKLRAQAARIRLEAEKSQVVLTLEKIDKLNSKLDMIKKQDLVDTKDQKAVEEELQRLKSQLIRDEKGVVQSVKAPTSAETKPLVALPSVDKASETQAADSIPLPSVNSTLSEEELEERVKQFEEAPEFLRILVSKTAGFGVDEKNPRLNAKDIVKKLYDDEVDYDSIFSKGAVQSDSDLEQARESLERAYEKSKSMDDVADGPVFSEEQIQAKVDEFDKIPKFLKDMNLELGLNNTDMAIMLLEEEYRENKRKEKGGGLFSLFGDKSDDKGKVGRDGERMDKDGSGAFSRLFSNDDSLNGTSLGKPEADLSFMMESLYPKSTRKEDETPDERQVNAFLSDIVASTKAFSPSGKPISVPGGWVSEDSV